MKNKWKRRIIAVSLLLSFALIMQNNVYVPVKPNVLYRYSNYGLVFPSTHKGVPTVNATILGTFWTNDTFSAGNPIEVQLTVATNMTNLLKYYCCIGMIDSTGDISYFGLHAADNNTNNEEYGAPVKTVAFSVSGPINYALLQGSVGFSNYSSYPQVKTSPLTIADASEITTIQFDHTTTQLTWIVIAFGIFLLQPIIEAVWGLENPTTTQSEDNRQAQQAH